MIEDLIFLVFMELAILIPFLLWERHIRKRIRRVREKLNAERLHRESEQ